VKPSEGSDRLVTRRVEGTLRGLMSSGFVKAVAL